MKNIFNSNYEDPSDVKLCLEPKHSSLWVRKHERQITVKYYVIERKGSFIIIKCKAGAPMQMHRVYCDPVYSTH